jgi:hypothetical protein
MALMASEIAICNSALIKIGADTILALDEGSDRANKLQLRYPMIRDAELRRRRWRFAIERATLAADSAAPDHGFQYQYTLPARCLRVIQIGEAHVGLDLSDYRESSSSAWSVEGRKILTNFPAPLAVRFIARITNTGLFDAAFTEALASRIALEMCERTTASDSKRQLAMADYRLAIREAATANALENPPESMAEDSWVAVRRG